MPVTEGTDRPSYSFSDIVPAEASRFFRNKGIRTGFSFWESEPQDHAVAFTVAKMMQVDLLEDARTLVQAAIDEGQTFEQFQRAWREREGLSDWLGSQKGRDPTGAIITAPRRLRTIYRSNLRAARAAGQWERIERTKRAMPFLLYQLGPSERHRPHHAAKQGLLLEVDDPFWDEWFPPNGWGCKCWVRQVSRREAERLGGPRQAPNVERREFVNPQTGETAMVPVGLDPSWRRNPGRIRLQNVQDMLMSRLEAAPDDVRRAALNDIASSWGVSRLFQGVDIGDVPVAELPSSVRSLSPARSALIQVSAASYRHTTGKDANRRPSDLGLLSDLSSARLSIQRSRGEHPRLVAVFDGDPAAADPLDRLDAAFFIVLKASGNFLDTFFRTDRTGRYLRGDGIEVLRE